MPADGALCIDAPGDLRGGALGDILALRLQKRGVAAVFPADVLVGDGAVVVPRALPKRGRNPAFGGVAPP